ncbi:LacI family DNA-binding transcriptional regulator [Streptomyces sp. NPDC058739]|uniref:LacI family DNA-binding transcriptional regulator n=1 Tax=Streptomyces sp. NPDC058739 TaxID=3346618 RepID=UPI0036CDE251
MSRSSSNPATRGGSVTLVTVAARAGVSAQTVSNALNNPDLLRTETLERVRRAIDETGYRPRRAAQTLRTRSSRLIGYGVRPVQAGKSTPVMDRFLHALSQAAESADYRVLLFATSSEEGGLRGYEELIDEHDVDGFVLSDNGERIDPRHAWLAQSRVPFVSFGRTWSKRQLGDWVDVDGASGTDTAVEHLIALGHHKIAFLGWPRGSGVGDDRANGWRRAMARHGLVTRGRRAESEEDLEAARQSACSLLDKGATAVVAASDTLALGCYRALRDRQAEAGRDVSVIGFDNSPISEMLSPPLTTIAQPVERVAHECIRLLLARIENPSKPPEQILLEPTILVRQSVSQPML